MLVKYLYRGIGPGLGTLAMALVLFNSMYLFGYSLEHVFIPNMEMYSQNNNLTLCKLPCGRGESSRYSPHVYYIIQ